MTCIIKQLKNVNSFNILVQVSHKMSALSSYAMLNVYLLLLEAKSQIMGEIEEAGVHTGKKERMRERVRKGGVKGGSKSRFVVLLSQLRH